MDNRILRSLQHPFIYFMIPQNWSLSEYSKEGIQYLLEKQEVATDYLSSTQQGRMSEGHRERLIEWVFSLCEAKNLPAKSAQQSTALIDRFLSKVPIKSLTTLELIGLIGLELILKYEHGGKIHPAQIQNDGNTQFPLEAIIYTEIMMTKTLGWDFDRPTASEILCLLFEHTCERFNYKNLLCRAEEYIKLCYCDYRLSLLPPSTIAVASAACVFEDLRYDEFKESWLHQIFSEFTMDPTGVEELCQEMRDRTRKSRLNSEDRSTDTSLE